MTKKKKDKTININSIFEILKRIRKIIYFSTNFQLKTFLVKILSLGFIIFTIRFDYKNNKNTLSFYQT